LECLERIHAVLHGGEPDRVPYVPYHNLVPRGDFERELRDRGMGLCVRCHAISEDTPGVAREHWTEDGVAYTKYKTPVGELTTGERVGLGRIADGGELRTKWPIQRPEDFEAAIYLIENTRFDADYDKYRNAVRDMGSDGIVRFEGPLPPYDAPRYDLGYGYFSLESWTMAKVDYPERIEQLLEALRRRADRVMPFVIDSPSEFISLGEVDGLYSAREYEHYVLPFYEKWRSALESAGKIWTVHAHNLNLSVYHEVVQRTGAPVIEAFTPPPVGDFSVADAREVWGSDTVIWVNFPETIFWSGREATYDYTVDLIRQDRGSGRLIIGATEMGSYGITDDRSERVFKEGMRAIMDAIDDQGTRH